MSAAHFADLAAEWWRIETAVNGDGITDTERDDLTKSQDPIIVGLAAAPATTIQELAAKLRIVWQYNVPPGDDFMAADRLFESILGDADRLAGAS